MANITSLQKARLNLGVLQKSSQEPVIAAYIAGLDSLDRYHRQLRGRRRHQQRQRHAETAASDKQATENLHKSGTTATATDTTNIKNMEFGRYLHDRGTMTPVVASVPLSAACPDLATTRDPVMMCGGPVSASPRFLPTSRSPRSRCPESSPNFPASRTLASFHASNNRIRHAAPSFGAMGGASAIGAMHGYSGGSDSRLKNSLSRPGNCDAGTGSRTNFPAVVGRSAAIRIPTRYIPVENSNLFRGIRGREQAAAQSSAAPATGPSQGVDKAGDIAGASSGVGAAAGIRITTSKGAGAPEAKTIFCRRLYSLAPP